MKHYVLSIFAILTITSFAAAANITPKMIAQKPNVYCKVHQPPNPIFLEGWTVKADNNHVVEFRLVKDGDQYGFYLFFQDDKKLKKKPHAKWRQMSIFGDQIATQGANIKFITKKGKVYYQYRGGKQFRMKKIASKPVKTKKK